MFVDGALEARMTRHRPSFDQVARDALDDFGVAQRHLLRPVNSAHTLSTPLTPARNRRWG
jgi:hypothetical protein